jgi:uncharacterized GH25 family protein
MLTDALRRFARFAAPTAVAALAAAAGAHEFWIMPSDFAVQPGELVRVELFHGERFAGDLVVRNTAQIERFEMVWPGFAAAAPAEVRGMHERPTSFVRPEQPGSGVIVYQTSEYINLLPAEKFEHYLIEEGLHEISRRRAQLGETGSPGREAYVRCAKALVRVGESEDPAADATAGLPLEIVLESGLRGSESEPIVARVLFEGAPISGLRVVAVAEGNPHELIELWTDAGGRVSLPAADTGPWLLTTLHMTRTVERDDVDWKSYWASLTFARPDGAAAQQKAQPLPNN